MGAVNPLPADKQSKLEKRASGEAREVVPGTNTWRAVANSRGHTPCMGTVSHFCSSVGFCLEITDSALPHLQIFQDRPAILIFFFFYEDVFQFFKIILWVK